MMDMTMDLKDGVMNVDRMLKYFGDIVPEEHIREIANVPENGWYGLSVEDEYLDIAIERMADFVKAQKRMTRRCIA